MISNYHKFKKMDQAIKKRRVKTGIPITKKVGKKTAAYVEAQRRYEQRRSAPVTVRFSDDQMTLLKIESIAQRISVGQLVKKIVLSYLSTKK